MERCVCYITSFLSCSQVTRCRGYLFIGKRKAVMTADVRLVQVGYIHLLVIHGRLDIAGADKVWRGDRGR